MIYGLGRREAPDPRDENYLIADVLRSAPQQPTRQFRYWNEGKIKLNQGPLPACVGYAWTHYIMNGPITAPKTFQPDPVGIYKAAQKVDEWPGENYAGTSIRAGAKVMQARGFISAYRWAWSVQTLIDTALNIGPVVVGTNWYRGMSWPDVNGIIHPTGKLDGGHAYLINGVNLKREFFRMEQSWDPSWGVTGNAWISFADMERLINEDGEICLADEIKKV